LLYTTLLLWKSVLPERGLLRKNKAWCPSCYEEMRKMNCVYDPLIWSIAASTVCTRHQRPYQTCCHYCNKENLFLSRRGIPGYCYHCNRWLGSNVYEKTDDTKAELLLLNLKRSRIIEDLINFSFSSEAMNITKDPLLSSLNKCLLKSFKNNLTLASKETRIPKSTLLGWLNGNSLPPLNSLLHLCSNFNLKLEQIFLDKINVKDLDYKIMVYYQKEDRKRYDYAALKRYLIDIIKRKEIISLSKIAEIVGCDRKLLSRNFPKECKIINEINRIYVLENKHNRLMYKIEILNKEFKFLLKSDIYPSRRKIEERLGSGFLKEKLLKTEWEELKNKHFKVN
jgi:transcriptional regulator with XRE-family HTH domain